MTWYVTVWCVDQDEGIKVATLYNSQSRKKMFTQVVLPSMLLIVDLIYGGIRNFDVFIPFQKRVSDEHTLAVKGDSFFVQLMRREVEEVQGKKSGGLLYLQKILLYQK